MLSPFLRSIRPFIGKQRLARFLLGKKIGQYNDIIILGKFGCKYKIPNIKEVIGFELFINGIFEEDSIRKILQNLPRQGVFIDLGANIGAISLPVAILRPDTRIICVEASRRMADYLAWNIRENGLRNITIENKAISSTSGTIVNFYSPNEQFGKGAIRENSGADMESVKTIDLETLADSHLIKKIDFIKADIEGFEYFAFKGGSKLLEGQDAPDILFEFIDTIEQSVPGLNPGDAQRLLKELGYNLYKIQKKHFKRLEHIITDGYAMIYASKREKLNY